MRGNANVRFPGYKCFLMGKMYTVWNIYSCIPFLMIILIPKKCKPACCMIWPPLPIYFWPDHKFQKPCINLFLNFLGPVQSALMVGSLVKLHMNDLLYTSLYRSKPVIKVFFYNSEPFNHIDAMPSKRLDGGRKLPWSPKITPPLLNMFGGCQWVVMAARVLMKASKSAILVFLLGTASNQPPYISFAVYFTSNRMFPSEA